jgi:hypothetical protein
MVLDLGSQSTLDRLGFRNYHFGNNTHMCSIFKLNENEQSSASLFKLEHKGHAPSFQFIFQSAGIGVKVQIKCPGCGKVKDITDYKSW